MGFAGSGQRLRIHLAPLAGVEKNVVDSKPDGAMFFAIGSKHAPRSSPVKRIAHGAGNAGLDESTLMHICKLTKLIVTRKAGECMKRYDSRADGNVDPRGERGRLQWMTRLSLATEAL